jgi:hypothetical protein
VEGYFINFALRIIIRLYINTLHLQTSGYYLKRRVLEIGDRIQFPLTTLFKNLFLCDCDYSLLQMSGLVPGGICNSDNRQYRNEQEYSSYDKAFLVIQPKATHNITFYMQIYKSIAHAYTIKYLQGAGFHSGPLRLHCYKDDLFGEVFLP